MSEQSTWHYSTSEDGERINIGQHPDDEHAQAHVDDLLPDGRVYLFQDDDRQYDSHRDEGYWFYWIPF